MKTRVLFLIGLMLLLFASVTTAEDAVKVQPIDSAVTDSAGSVVKQGADQYVISYLHMNRRCMTCEKLEAYSGEAVSSGFTEQLQDSSIVWRIVNFEEEGNEHFAKDYQLYSQSLIISKQRDGEEIEWKNLDKIWELVSDQEKFTEYIQSETKAFVAQEDE